MKKGFEIRTGSYLHMESVVTLAYRAGEGLNNIFSTGVRIRTIEIVPSLKNYRNLTMIPR